MKWQCMRSRKNGDDGPLGGAAFGALTRDRRRRATGGWMGQTWAAFAVLLVASLGGCASHTVKVEM